jgi:pimeloyl-ACP methyl ester carboxylesterase
MKALKLLLWFVLSCLSDVAWAAPQSATCPAGLPDGTQCFNGWDEAGAGYWIALPAGWKNSAGVLVLHSHGGPELGAPKLERSAADLQRWKVMLRAGQAWAGSTFRQGGVAMHSAAEDTERLHKLFVERFGRPRLTLLHGQSWGAGVAAVAAELYPSAYDGVLLTSGVLAGGTRSYDFRLDLRVVWQALCRNHPRPDEPAYPLWQGLPEGATMTRAELNRRIDECTGLSHPAAERSAEQQQRLKTLLAVNRIPERSLAGHLAWATFHFQDIAFQRLGGRNAFGNIGARYRGSNDDEALNAQVERYRADPAAVAALGADTDPNGRIPVPVLSVRAIDDPVAFVELDSVFAQTMERGGSAARLVQTYTDDHEHSYLSDVQYVAALQALLAWVEHREKPSPASLAHRCKALEADWGAACRYRPEYRPAPLEGRVTPRER